MGTPEVPATMGIDDQKTTLELQAILEEIRDHLSKSQDLMDTINPDSIFSARVQQLLDELVEHTIRDITSPSSGLVAEYGNAFGNYPQNGDEIS